MRTNSPDRPRLRAAPGFEGVSEERVLAALASDDPGDPVVREVERLLAEIEAHLARGLGGGLAGPDFEAAHPIERVALALFARTFEGC